MELYNRILVFFISQQLDDVISSCGTHISNGKISIFKIAKQQNVWRAWIFFKQKLNLASILNYLSSDIYLDNLLDGSLGSNILSVFSMLFGFILDKFLWKLFRIISIKHNKGPYKYISCNDNDDPASNIIFWIF